MACTHACLHHRDSLLAQTTRRPTLHTCARRCTHTHTRACAHTHRAPETHPVHRHSCSLTHMIHTLCTDTHVHTNTRTHTSLGGSRCAWTPHSHSHTQMRTRPRPRVDAQPTPSSTRSSCSRTSSGVDPSPRICYSSTQILSVLLRQSSGTRSRPGGRWPGFKSHLHPWPATPGKAHSGPQRFTFKRWKPPLTSPAGVLADTMIIPILQRRDRHGGLGTRACPFPLRGRMYQPSPVGSTAQSSHASLSFRLQEGQPLSHFGTSASLCLEYVPSISYCYYPKTRWSSIPSHIPFCLPRNYGNSSLWVNN